MLIVANAPLVQAGLGTLLVDRSGYTVVGQVAWNLDLPAEMALYRRDIVVWDLGWNPALAPAGLLRSAWNV